MKASARGQNANQLIFMYYPAYVNPMATLINRASGARGAPAEVSQARAFSRLSFFIRAVISVRFTAPR